MYIDRLRKQDFKVKDGIAMYASLSSSAAAMDFGTKTFSGGYERMGLFRLSGGVSKQRGSYLRVMWGNAVIIPSL